MLKWNVKYAQKSQSVEIAQSYSRFEYVRVWLRTREKQRKSEVYRQGGERDHRSTVWRGDNAQKEKEVD